jgi:PAS domain S-box-containing protein
MKDQTKSKRQLLEELHILRKQIKLPNDEDIRKIEELKNTHRIINRSPAVVFIWKNEQGWPVEFVSENVLGLTGHSQAEFLKNKIVYADIIYSEDLPMVRDELNKYSQNKNIKNFMHSAYRILSKDGTLKWLRDITEVKRDSDGNITHFEGIVLDISDLKKVELQLAEKEDWLSKIRIAANDGTWDLDLKSNTVYFDPIYYQMAGYKTDEFPHTLEEFEKRVHPDDISMVMQESKKHFLGETKQFKVEFRFKKKDGNWLWILGRGKLVEWEQSGKPRRFVGTHTDISDRKSIEETLNKTALKLRLLADYTYDWEYWIDVNGNYNYLSPSVRRITGYNMQDFISRPELLFEIIRDDYRERVMNHYHDENNRNTPVTTIEFPIIHKDGTEIWIDHHCSPVFDKQGNYAGRRGNNRDITERRKAEKALLYSEEKMSSIFRVAPTGIGLVKDRILVEVNPQICKISGYRKEELIGKSARFLYPAQDDFDFVGKEKYRQIAQHGTGVVETRWQKKDGSVINILLASTPIDTKHQSKGVTFTVLDITERKQAEAEQGRLLTAIDQAAESIVITDSQGIIQYVNPAFERITGYTFDEVKGKNPSILKSGKHSQSFYQELWNTILAGKVWKGKLTNRRKDGSLYSEESTISPVFNLDENISNYVAVKRDITKEEQLEQQFRQAQKMESIGRLAGGVAHDFNNMLAVIMGYSEMALMHLNPSDKIYKDIQEINKAGQRSADLTTQLLAFSRKQTIKPRILDLGDAVASMLKMLRRLIGEDINLIWKPGENLWPIRMDPTQIDQILANMCVNARDAIDETGKIIIQTENVVFDKAYCDMHTYAEPGSFVMLTISEMVVVWTSRQ